MEERYARQTMLPEIGEQGQRRLSEASVLIVGIGGLGSAAALYLTGAGVGRIGLADADTVSKSNLQRQVLYTERQIGMPKSAAARERLAALSSHTAFECWPEGITPENARPILDGYDRYSTAATTFRPVTCSTTYVPPAENPGCTARSGSFTVR